MTEQPSKRVIRAILLRYARPDPRGGYARCSPSREERDGQLWRSAGNDNKVIYDSWEQARDCARGLVQVGCEQQRVFPCPRARTTPHFHLAARLERKSKARHGHYHPPKG